MVLLHTPEKKNDFKAPDFALKSVKGRNVTLDDCMGGNGVLVMFICNHCPYVKAVIKDIVNDTSVLKKMGVETMAIMSNDTKNYPDDSFDKMLEFSKKNNFQFPYLFDETQKVAKKFGAVCTPDFFFYNNQLELQYRGRLKELKDLKPVNTGESDLLKAIKIIIKTGKGPENQIPSMGCNIKWIK